MKNIKKKILVIAAHPDDEMLGCGAAVALHTVKGDEVQSIILCEGETMRGQNSGKKTYASQCASDVLGTKQPIMIGFLDQHLDTLPIVEVASPIEKVVREFQPNIVYCQFGGDLNKDHKIVFEAAMVALRPKNEFIEEIYCFYTVGSSEWNYPSTFVPNTWICFDKNIMDKKINAFKCYETEVCIYPNPRSEEALINLAKFSGNQVCAEYAESFVSVRKIVR